MENEEHSAASGGGAGVEAPKQDADQNAQATDRGQSPEPTQVESGESQASSRKDQARSNSNWANQRLIEKAVQKVLSSTLEAKLSPLMERLSQAPQPPSPSTTAEDEIDYQNLSGSIKKLVEKALESRLKESLGRTIPKIKEELTSSIRSTSKVQEARNYLISQNDIGQDQAKHDEIQEIIANDPILYNSVEKLPFEVIKEAVKRWRSTKVNPNTPGKGELSTVGSGMSGGQRRTGTPSVQKLQELQNKVIGNLPSEEREKLNKEIQDLMALMR